MKPRGLISGVVPTISVALATFNGARYIGEQLESLAKQAMLPLELIVFDDRSTDETAAIVRRFAETAPFDVRVSINEENLGYRANFMQCVVTCKGDLIAFCDQDDIWDPDKLSAVVTAYCQTASMMIYHDVRLVDELGQTVDDSSVPTFKKCSDFRVVHGLCQVFHRSLIRYVYLWSLSVDQFAAGSRMAHDQFFFFIAVSANSVFHLPRPLLSYRQHGNNLFGAELRRKAKTGILYTMSVMLLWLIGHRGPFRRRKMLWYSQLSGEYRCCISRIDILESILSDGKEIGEMSIALDRHRNLKAKLKARFAIFEESRWTRRTRLLFAALIGGAYAATYRGFKDIGLDFLLGVPS